MKHWEASLCALSIATAPTLAYAQASPSGFTTGHRYDLMGREVGTISPSPGSDTPGGYPAVRKTYDADGHLTTVEKGSLAAWPSEPAWQSAQAMPANWSNFTVFQTTTNTYDLLDRKTSEKTTGADGTVYALTQYSYDSDGRLQCTAVRMNPSLYSSLPSSACTITPPSSTTLPDRITVNAYDAAGRLVQIVKAFGVTTSNGFTQNLQQAYATYAYSANGKQTDIIDANGNHAQLKYDGFDRQTYWYFPSKTPAASFDGTNQNTAINSSNSFDTSDFEEYNYDPVGNRTYLQKRDGTILTFNYDNLNRLSSKTISSTNSLLPSTDQRWVYYAYDLQGRQTQAWFDTPTSGIGVTNTYDAFGRQISTSLAMDGASAHTITYCYDADGNRTLVGNLGTTVGTCPTGSGQPTGWSDYVWYIYDGLDRPSSIITSAGTTPATYTYNLDGTRLSFGSNSAAITTSYAYDPVDRLASLTNAPANSAYTSTISGPCTIGTTSAASLCYNPANQITGSTTSNNYFVFTDAYNVTRPYQVDGLNQYTCVNSSNSSTCSGGTGFTYDANGNLTGDGVNTFTYDAENRLIGVAGGKNAALRYDPLGRLYEVTSSASTTRFIYGGDKLIAEYDASGNLLRRYVHGADIKSDDPIAWYEGAAFASSAERLLRPNWQGSIALITDTAGQSVYAANTYDEYGIPGSYNAGRFQYTGQTWIPELGMYYYKSRMYSPTLGRFMQTDPIGYKDQIDLYDYADDDPENKIDPTGLAKDDSLGEIQKKFQKLTSSGGTITVNIGGETVTITRSGDNVTITSKNGTISGEYKPLNQTGFEIVGPKLTPSNSMFSARSEPGKTQVARAKIAQHWNDDRNHSKGINTQLNVSWKYQEQIKGPLGVTVFTWHGDDANGNQHLYGF